MIFNEQHFKKYCDDLPYELTLDKHLMSYEKFCRAYAIAMSLSLPQTINWLKNKSVLDAGCAMGHVVKDLCDNGINAWGFEPSDYAIRHRVSNRIWCGDNDTEFESYPDNLYNIIYANSFQYTFDQKQLNNWINNSYRICSHSVVFCSVVQDDPQESIMENSEEIQIMRPRYWWNEQFTKTGFVSHRCVGPTVTIYFKHEGNE